MPPEYYDLRCLGCGWCEVCGPEGMVRWLRSVGKVRPGREPDQEILGALFHAVAAQLTCPQCGRNGLNAALAADDEQAFAGLGPIPCDGCGQPIPPERLEALPGTKLCTACQNREELGEPSGSPEYCPRCGNVMEVRLSRSAGIARYVMSCPACRTAAR